MVDIDNIAVLSGLTQKMQYLNERQGVLAQNIANANTPGYKPMDLKKPDFGAAVQQASQKLAMTVTAPGHIQSPNGAGGGFQKIQNKDFSEATPSGNAVSLEEETLKMSKNSMDYQATTMLYHSLTSLFSIAITGNSS